MKVLEKDGLKYVDEGQGETILFFHGWGVSPFSYKIIIELLASKFRIIAPFISSFKDFKKEEDVIKALLDQEKIDKLLVMGHSAGGSSALSFSHDFKNRIKALILLDSVGNGKSKSFAESIAKMLGYALGRLIHFDKINRTIFRDALSNVGNLRNLLKDMGFVQYYKINTKEFKFPVLILWGKRDKLISIQNGYELQKSIKGARLRKVDGDHYWFLYNPNLLNKEIEEIAK
jgi:2-hydroxy-6-oxonona-2,4-dienedioate hydrolase